MPSPARAVADLKRTEHLTALILILAGALLRFAYTLHHDVNSDEPQHLHVAWGWAQDLLPYRDVFDNHSPLFSMLLAPLLAAFGERPDIVVLMRLAMSPLAGVTLWATWVLARRLFGQRAALWTIAIAGAQPDFVQKSVEYRTDVLWMAAWMSSLAVLFDARPTPWRAFLGGLLVGLSFAVSMKTSLLAAAFTIATLATFVMIFLRGNRALVSAPAGTVAAALAGTIVVPAAFAAFFAIRHAWAPFVYGVISHNYVPGLGNWKSEPWLPLLLLPAFPLLIWCAARLVRTAPGEPTGAARSVLFLTMAFYWLGVETLWPLVTRQDWLPFIPMASAVATFLLLGLLESRRVPAGLRGAAWVVLPLVVVLEMCAVARSETFWQDHTTLQRTTMTEILHLTSPAEPVLDVRGEAIFRSRPIYAVFESIMRARIRRGLNRDEVRERVLATHTAVAFHDFDEWPDHGRDFLTRNFVSVGLWRVVGHLLAPRVSDAPISFDIAIPQLYTIVTRSGVGHGTLDGAPLTAPRVLASGPHVYRAASGETPIAVIWAPAIERGFRPVVP